MAPAALRDVSLSPASLLSCLSPSQEEYSDRAGLRGVTEVTMWLRPQSLQ